MSKEVIIYIKGTQIVDGEKDSIELITRGRYYKRRDALYLSYDEKDEEDVTYTMKSLIKIEGEKMVTLTRSGKRRQQLIIESDRRHQCIYGSEYGDWVMGVNGGKIKNCLEPNGGTLDFNYSLDINASVASENEMNIIVKECE